MKKLFIISLLIVSLVIVFFGGCAEEEAPTEAIELRFASHQPPVSDSIKAAKEWADQINEATNGGVVITFYEASTLLGERDMMSGLRAGVADIVEMLPEDFASEFPLTPIIALPFMGLGDTRTVYKILAELEEEFPELQQEYRTEFKILFTSARTDIALHTANKMVIAPEDTEGMKIWAMPMLQKVLEDANATPMFMPIPDVYTSLDRGLISGIGLPTESIMQIGIDEMVPYHTIFPSGIQFGLGMYLMNIDAWNSLPSEYQQAFDELSAWGTEKQTSVTENGNAAAITALKEKGQFFVTLSLDEEELWFELASATHMEYLAGLDAMGLPATEIYEEALRLAALYRE